VGRRIQIIQIWVRAEHIPASAASSRAEAAGTAQLRSRITLSCTLDDRAGRSRRVDGG
jgi:hypothetical protein